MLTHLIGKFIYSANTNFNNNADGYWVESNATISGGAQTDPAAGGQSHITSTFYLQDDYDIEAEYISSDPGYITAATISFETGRASDFECIAVGRQTTNAISGDEKQYGGYDGCGSTIMNGYAGYFNDAAIAGTTRMRLVRVGNTISFYVKYDQQVGFPAADWILVGDDGGFGAGLDDGVDTKVRLRTISHGPGNPTFTCQWTYFKINSADNVVYV